MLYAVIPTDRSANGGFVVLVRDLFRLRSRDVSEHERGTKSGSIDLVFERK